MSSYKLVQRPAVNELDSHVVKDTEEVAETGGIVFSDDRCLELIRDDAGHLSLLDSTRKRGAQRIEYQGRTYVPPKIDASLSEALILPQGRASGSTADIFARSCSLFMEHCFSEEVAKKSTYWALCTWFAELFPAAPCLVVTGSRPEAHLILQLLACIVRHGLLLADITLSILRSLPMHIQPTLLVNHVSPPLSKVLSVSNFPRAYVPTRNGVADLYCAKALYAGTRLVHDDIDGSFRIHLAPLRGKLPVISEFAQRKLAADFQPLLLDYRIGHVAEVRDSDFDIPTLDSELRILTRVLGSAIVDATELRTGLVSLLQEYQDEIRAEDAFNGESIVVEALLSHSHSEPSDQLVYVGQLADTSNRILKDRGLREKLEPKALGWILRNSLGFTPKRNGQGFAIRLTEDVRRRIHQLSREFQVPAMNETPTVCSQCTEMLTSEGEEGKLGLGNRTVNISPA
jgi:hypothetical protein